MLTAGVSDGVLISPESGMDLGRGAIAGAFIVGAAFLAGYAAIRRSGLALCALLMVALAAALEFSWLGLLPSLPKEATVLLLGLFAASGVIFLSATVSAAKYNPILGGLMFTGALVLGGLGLINFVDRIDVAPLLRWGAIAFGGFAVILALTQAFRGDAGARLILPGVAMAILAPIVGPLGTFEASAAALASHGLFTMGVLAASLVVLSEGFTSIAAPQSPAATNFSFNAAEHDDDSEHSQTVSSAGAKRERAEVVIDSQLGKVLDYAGIAIWDWSDELIDQTESLPSLLGADSEALFTPDALRQFIHKDDLKILENEILAPEDGPFDVSLKLFDGRLIRLRGARAATENPAELERVVAFIELADAKMTDHPVDSRRVQDATRAAIVPGAGLAGGASAEFDVEKVVAAFQPIVSLNDMKTVGYEALARLDGKEGDTASLIRTAAHVGKSGDLALAMLGQAAEFLAQERKAHKNNAPSFVAMNVSWTQMKDPAFAGAVEAAMKKYDLPRGSVVLELTEGEAIGDAVAATPVFRKLKSLGASLAFDDFGAGFSCLTNVRKYDFDYIKIDKSFAEDLCGDGDGGKIAAALAAMGKDLGLKVIIEGIESREAAKAASALGCAYGQGYGLGRPGVSENRKAAKASKSGKKSLAPAPDESVVDKKAVLQKTASARSADGQTKAAADDKSKDEAIALTSDLIAEAANDERPSRWRPWKRGAF